MLLHEGDRRIKNSLQIVASLMHLQAGRELSTPAAEALTVAAVRIQSIAHIHDALKTSAGQDAVDLGEVLAAMCQSLQQMVGDQSSVTILAEVEPIQAPVALSQPVVLAVNELVVNALRHAFPGDRRGTIRVSAALVEDELKIVVADDGVGLPAEYATGRGYGTKLVRMMIKQIAGELYVDCKAGAQFTIYAPAPAMTGRMQGCDAPAGAI